MEPHLKAHPLGKNLAREGAYKEIRDRPSKIFNDADGLLNEASAQILLLRGVLNTAPATLQIILRQLPHRLVLC